MSKPVKLSPIAEAYRWTSRIMTIAIGMVAPGLAAWWLDGQLGTLPWLTILGFVLGFAFALWRLMMLTKQRPKS